MKLIRNFAHEISKTVSIFINKYVYEKVVFDVSCCQPVIDCDGTG